MHSANGSLMTTKCMAQLHSCQVPDSNGTIAATADECLTSALQCSNTRSMSLQSFPLLPCLAIVDTDGPIYIRDEDVSVIEADASGVSCAKKDR
jgi:hypothetical protein